MRYERGLIQISECADLPIPRLVYRAGHLTTRQLYESVHAGLGEGNVEQLKWESAAACATRVS